MILIRILRLRDDEPTPYDGQWLVEYDPRRTGVDPDGRPMLAHLVTTDDPALAMRFDNATEVYRLWRSESGHTRPDGLPDRPLTAFSIAIERAP